jgi:hypothetical protein
MAEKERNGRDEKIKMDMGKTPLTAEIEDVAKALAVRKLNTNVTGCLRTHGWTKCRL